jgi:hypothetical protein
MYNGWQLGLALADLEATPLAVAGTTIVTGFQCHLRIVVENFIAQAGESCS